MLPDDVRESNCESGVFWGCGVMAPFLRSRLEAQSPDDEFEEDDLCRSIALRLGIMDDVRFRVMEELSVT